MQVQQLGLTDRPKRWDVSGSVIGVFTAATAKDESTGKEEAGQQRRDTTRAAKARCGEEHPSAKKQAEGVFASDRSVDRGGIIEDWL
ncbi:MAG: hypothetical protein ACRYFU_05475 [Janthinobacterium lividum]